MSELRNAAAARMRPAGTSTLITGLVAGATGTAVLVIGMIAAQIEAASQTGMFRNGLDTGHTIAALGGVTGILVGVVLLVVGLVQRLAGGPGKPVNAGRAAGIGAAIPGVLGAVGLLAGLLV